MLDAMEERFYKITHNGKYYGTVPWKHRDAYIKLCGIKLKKNELITIDIDFNLFNKETT